jgi:tripartite-type tricarboxylate transporter receptor subunit TctC
VSSGEASHETSTPSIFTTGRRCRRAAGCCAGGESTNLSGADGHDHRASRAGGSTDVAARIIGEYISRALGQQFIIENVAGAGGTTAATRAMRAKPDGYTILMGHTGTHAFSVSFYPNLPYKPDIDFEPIGTVLEIPELIVARKDLPPKDLKEFIAYVRANAEKLNVGHAGVGSLLFTYALLLNTVLGVKPTMVPFTGAAPVANALIGGQVDYCLNGISEVGQLILAVTIKAYAIATADRHPALPNVPTTVEAGLPEYSASSWFALFAPKGVPQPILDKLTNALDQALDDDSVRRRLVDIGGSIPAKAKRGQQQLAALVKSEIGVGRRSSKLRIPKRGENLGRGRLRVRQSHRASWPPRQDLLRLRTRDEASPPSCEYLNTLHAHEVWIRP